MKFCPECGTRLSSPLPVTCDECGTRHWKNAKPCAGALVTRADGRLLLVRRDHEPWRGRWDIPGGFCEAEEHPRATAVREVREETGLDVTATGLLGIWLDRYPPAAVTLNLYFLATVDGGAEAPQAGEVSEIRWFGADQLPGRDDLAFPDHVSMVLAAWHARRAGGSGRVVLG